MYLGSLDRILPSLSEIPTILLSLRKRGSLIFQEERNLLYLRNECHEAAEDDCIVYCPGNVATLIEVGWCFSYGETQINTIQQQHYLHCGNKDAHYENTPVIYNAIFHGCKIIIFR